MLVQIATKALKKLLIKNAAFSNPLSTLKFTKLYKLPHFVDIYKSQFQTHSLIPDYC